MYENENLVTENVTENAENTAEQTPAKTFTQDELNEIVGKAKARERAKITKQYERQNAEVNELVKTLEQGTGREGIRELNEIFTDHYTKQGRIKKNPEAKYSESDIEALARADANEFISYGDEDAAEEFNRLEALGAKMTKREQATFKILAEHLAGAETSRELAKIGVTEEEYKSEEFQSFAKKFNSNTPIKDIYDIYSKTKPKKEIKTMGSMKTGNSADNGIKDFYTIEEARRFTQKDFENNPKLYEKVVESSHKW